MFYHQYLEEKPDSALAEIAVSEKYKVYKVIADILKKFLRDNIVN